MREREREQRQERWGGIEKDKPPLKNILNAFCSVSNINKDKDKLTTQKLVLIN